MIRSLVGTVCYQPPEMWTAHPKYDSKVDVYSCAMVFWEMLQWHKAEKKYPWEGSNECDSRCIRPASCFEADRSGSPRRHAIYDLVGAKRLRPSVHKLHTQWGSDIVDLMEEMWVQEPKERPTMTAVVERLEAILKTC
jgi:serine/threonine protein kinase